MDKQQIVIVGGGLVGATLALGLGRMGYQVMVLEAHQLHQQQSSYDERVIALSYGSKQIFQALQIWPALAAFATPIEHIHISTKGNLGTSKLHREDTFKSALGYVIASRQLGEVLLAELAALENVQYLSPASFVDMEQHADFNRVKYHHAGQNLYVDCQLTIAADGQHSKVVEQLDHPQQNQSYDQAALIANVSLDEPHQNWAYERFTAWGPMALLPMQDQRMSLVWTMPPEQAPEYQHMPESEFLQALQAQFGYRAGNFVKVGQRQIYPLMIQYLQQQFAGRLLVMGNAAHTVHPVAGQGFNLGLRDVVGLLEVLVHHMPDPGQASVLSAYQRARSLDQQSVVSYTDKLVKLFSNENPLLGHLRGAGLLVLELSPLIKQEVEKFNMGLLTGRNNLLSGRTIR